MLEILAIPLPIFAVVAIGFAVTRRELFTAAELGVLGRFVTNLGLPSLMFAAVSGDRIGAVLDVPYLVVYAAGSVLSLGLALVWYRAVMDTATRAAIGALGAAVANSTFIGYPIMVLAFPAIAAPVLAMNVMVEMALIFPICFAVLATSASGGAGGFGAVLRASLGDLARRPMVWGLSAGLVFAGAGLPVPEVVAQVAALLGAATPPLALMFIGGSLAGLKLQGNRAAAAQIVAGKLVLHPLVVAAVLALAGLAGLAVPEGDLAAAAVLSAAMPVIGIYAVLAAEKGHAGMASLAQLGATVAGFFTISAVLALVG